jgi:hypothetical protein
VEFISPKISLISGFYGIHTHHYMSNYYSNVLVKSFFSSFSFWDFNCDFFEGDFCFFVQFWISIFFNMPPSLGLNYIWILRLTSLSMPHKYQNVPHNHNIPSQPIFHLVPKISLFLMIIFFLIFFSFFSHRPSLPSKSTHIIESSSIQSMELDPAWLGMFDRFLISNITLV